MSKRSFFPYLSEDILAKAKRIKLMGLDVDGVLSDGKLLFSAQGDEIKGFCTLDGHGIKMLQQNGIRVAIITGRNSPLVARRARDLGVQYLIQGREDKRVALLEVCSETGIALEETAYMGDDLPDLSAMQACGLAFTVPNAHFHVQAKADVCTRAKGGHGAVREAADIILDSQGLLETLLKEFETK